MCFIRFHVLTILVFLSLDLLKQTGLIGTYLALTRLLTIISFSNLVRQQLTRLAQGGQQRWAVASSQVCAQEQDILVLVEYISFIVEVSCAQLVLEHSLMFELLVLFTHELQILE